MRGVCNTELKRSISFGINHAILRCLGFAPRSQSFVHVAMQQCTQSVRYPDSFYSVRPQIRFTQNDATSCPPLAGGPKSLISRRGKKVAFTLAEVLISLGIIGVVAAITIPSLIQSYKEQVTVTKVQKAYSVLNQVFKSISAEYGEPKDWPGVEYVGNGCASCSTIHRDLYAQYIVGCKKFDGQIYGTVDTSKKIKALNGELYTYLYYFPSFTNSDGIVFQFGSFRNCGGYFLSTGNLSACSMGGDILIDINGYDKDPNQLGKDIFAFTTAKTGVYPAGMVGSYAAGDCNLNGRGISCSEYVLREKNLKYLHKK